MSKNKNKDYRVVGIDLAGAENRETGWALLQDYNVKVLTLYSNEEILRKTLEVRPLIVAIDAPLTLPKKGKMRLADKEIKKLGCAVLPPLFPGMKMLTLRGIYLASKIQESGIKVIEVHPTSSRKILGLPVAKDVEKIRFSLLKLGIKGDIEEKKLTIHELDAIVAAFTAKLHIRGQTAKVGNEEEGYIIIPNLSIKR
ncbi:MAG: DUF429 domain-containing protein [Candidatus Baldrarchaeia archaeon]